jgi:hypothetical protein
MKTTEPEMKDAAMDYSLPGRILVLGTVSGGILLGGLLVGGLTAAGRLAPHGVPGIAAIFFLPGCLLGAFTALPLGLFGCPVGVSRRDAGRALLNGLVFVIPAIIMAAVLSGWAALAGIAVYRNGPVLRLTVGAAWLLGLAVVIITLCDGFTCLQNMWLRWRSQAEFAGTAAASPDFRDAAAAAIEDEDLTGAAVADCQVTIAQERARQGEVELGLRIRLISANHV